MLDATELCEEMILGRGELIGLMSRVVHVALDLVLFGPEPTLGHDLFEDLTFADIVVEVMPVARCEHLHIRDRIEVTVDDTPGSIIHQNGFCLHGVNRISA